MTGRPSFSGTVQFSLTDVSESCTTSGALGGTSLTESNQKEDKLNPEHF